MAIEKRKSTSYEKAIVVAVNKENDQNLLDEELDELILLSDTAGAKVIDTIVQNRAKIDSSTFIGSGKAQSIINQSKTLGVTVLIFNNELTPAQLKNIQKMAGDNLKVIDRTGLILDIFEKHAKTKEAKVQIKLARLQYLLPRLTRQWTHLERQMGGVGTRGGPGETQIEIDRRLIRNQIASLKKELKNIQKQRVTQHKKRDEIYKVSLIGYTNSGKSTIMQSLSDSNIYVQDQLFATLDTTTRKIKNKDNHDFLLSDTVGFIRNLPHDLIASFRSTLMEIEESDLILKIIDSSSKSIDLHLATIKEALDTLKIESKLELIVFNKIDLIGKDDLHKIKRMYPNSLFISAVKELKINELLNEIQKKLSELNEVVELSIPYQKLSVIDYIYKTSKIISRADEYEEVILKIESSSSNIRKIKSIIK
tara:strand:+ start:3630 stop:4898 length:1269 start_codon:yes stop_codon:yes gene_type:complete